MILGALRSLCAGHYRVAELKVRTIRAVNAQAQIIDFVCVFWGQPVQRAGTCGGQSNRVHAKPRRPHRRRRADEIAGDVRRH
jgi:hypothetical protein